MESSRSLSLLSVRDRGRNTHQAERERGRDGQTDRQTGSEEKGIRERNRERGRWERRDGGQMLSAGMQVWEEQEEGSQGHTFNSKKVRGGGGKKNRESLINEETEKMRNCRGGGVKKQQGVPEEEEEVLSLRRKMSPVGYHYRLRE